MMTTSNVQQKLDRLRNRPTLNELTITSPDGTRKLLVAYIQGKSRNSIFKAVTKKGRAEKLVETTGDTQIHFAKRVADGATMGGWTINLSGRTERQAISEGELEYICG